MKYNELAWHTLLDLLTGRLGIVAGEAAASDPYFLDLS